MTVHRTSPGALAALESNPSDAWAWCDMGLACLGAQEYAEARIHFTRATALMPLHMGCWHGLGWSCMLLHDMPAALSAFQQALALNGHFAENQGSVALALWLAGRREEAEFHFALADNLERRSITGRYARALKTGQLREDAVVRGVASRLLAHPALFGDRRGF